MSGVIGWVKGSWVALLVGVLLGRFILGRFI